MTSDPPDTAPTPDGGLSPEDAARRLARFGPNRLPTATGRLWPRLLLRQVANPMVVLLVVAAVVALALGERIDAAAIVAVVILNAALGFVQDWRAETALAALRDMLTPTTRVIRGGRDTVIDADQLVPGDLVRLAAGDSVPADITLRSGATLQLDESALTGESVAVDKGAEDRELSQGTLVLTGTGLGQVTATGAETRFGRIATLTTQSRRGESVLQARVTRLSRQIGLAAIGIAAGVLVLGIAMGEPPLAMVMTATALAVSIVPEGLPAVLTVTLALGAAMLVRRRALVRRLPALETLGAATVICTDKTGTLTGNQMTAVAIWTPAGHYEVTGTGYTPEGEIRTEDGPKLAETDQGLADLLATARLCNTARLEQTESGWHPVGSPTEAALLVLAAKGGCPEPPADAVRGGTPFSSERKRMSVLTCGPEGHALHAKGAPESILAVADRCLGPDGIASLDDTARKRITQAYTDMAGKGLRVIALARREAAPQDTDESGLVFTGLVGLIDPPRPEVPDAVAACRSAGVRVILITGDGPETAMAVARSVGLDPRTALTGPDLDALDDDALARLLQTDPLFARARPEDKQRIVRALQANGDVVGMTGDGVNDAPALKAADIGIAMGQRGTDVAREAADLVLLDDNFATIVEGIAEGRRQFDNIRKFTVYLLSSNFGEVVALAGTLLLGLPLIFSVAQLLWINLVTDSVVALALGLEKREPKQMRRPPYGRSEPILNRTGLWLILAFGAYVGLAALWLFATLLPDGEVQARSAAFTALVASELIIVFAFRSFDRPVLTRHPLSNPALLYVAAGAALLQLAAVTWAPLQLFLDTETLGAEAWLFAGLILLPPLIVPEAVKWTLARRADTRA